jgi:hypothetical protein
MEHQLDDSSKRDARGNVLNKYVTNEEENEVEWEWRNVKQDVL